MLVKATKLGFYNHERRKEGAVFNLIPRVGRKKSDGTPGPTLTTEGQFSSTWMEKMVEKKVPKVEVEESEVVEVVKKKPGRPRKVI